MDDSKDIKIVYPSDVFAALKTYCRMYESDEDDEVQLRAIYMTGGKISHFVIFEKGNAENYISIKQDIIKESAKGEKADLNNFISDIVHEYGIVSETDYFN